MLYIRSLAVIALIGSIAWTIADPGYEPLITGVTSLSALIATFIVNRRAARCAAQRQSVSKGSIGVQAGGDVRIVNIGAVKDAR